MIVNKFNRGEIGEKAFARDDVQKVNNSAALMENFMPERLGVMGYRPGTTYLGATAAATYCVPFVSATDDTAILEFSSGQVRFWVDDALVTRTAVTTTITNDSFTSNITGWTDNSGAGSSTGWVSGGYASLTGTGGTKAELYQIITSTEHDAEHGLRININFGECVVKIGTSGAGSSNIYEGTLERGIHSLSFTPTSDFTITFVNSSTTPCWIASCEIESAGVLSIPITIDNTNLDSLRYTQSVDVTFLTRSGYRPFKIERRGTKSWSGVVYLAKNGPFGNINISDITLTPGALTGITTLTASRSFFKAEHVDTLFRLESTGQTVTASASAQDSGTDNVFVTGVSGTRSMSLDISGTFTATVTLQRSVDEATWEDVKTYTTATTENYSDSLDNAELYYRLHIKTGDYTSGTADLEIQITSGSISGIAIVQNFTSSTSVQIGILKAFGATDATRDWYQGRFSEVTGYPTSVRLYESRLWFAGKNTIWGSESDNYYSFDDAVEGNSAPISRTLGFGPADDINWMAQSTRLVLGIAGGEITARSSAYGEALTNTNVNLKMHSTQGSAGIVPAEIDDSVLFVQRSGNHLYSLEHDVDKDGHYAFDLTNLHPEICSAGIKRMAVVRQPETRIYVVLDDGEARVYLLDRGEDVKAWSRITTDGDIEDVVALPGVEEDQVFFVVNRDNGRYLEKQAKHSECIGASKSVHFDSAVVYSSPGTATLTGLGHLNNETVGVWADGTDLGDYTISGSQIIVPSSSYTNVVVGIRHTANFTTNKLSRYSKYSVVNQRKQVIDVGLVMTDYLHERIKIGPSSSNLYPLPTIEGGKAASGVISSYDEIPIPFDGMSETDPRIHIQATGPCSILALTYDISEESNDTTDKEG